MNIKRTTLERVLRIELDVFEDFRGQYVETYNKKLYQDSGIDLNFIQDDISVSKKNVLRGIHGDNETHKLISCLYGELYLVAVNCDTGSKDFGRWEAFTLSDKNRLQILVPAKYGNAHLVLSEKAIFHYKQTTYYDRSKQFTYKWNDPKFNISWPIENPILSKRDRGGDNV